MVVKGRIIESERTGYDCTGVREGGPMGSQECVNQTILFLQRSRTHVWRWNTGGNLGCTPQSGRRPSEGTNQLISFKGCLLLLPPTPRGTPRCSSARCS